MKFEENSAFLHLKTAQFSLLSLQQRWILTAQLLKGNFAWSTIGAEWVQLEMKNNFSISWRCRVKTELMGNFLFRWIAYCFTCEGLRQILKWFFHVLEEIYSCNSTYFFPFISIKAGNSLEPQNISKKLQKGSTRVLLVASHMQEILRSKLQLPSKAIFQATWKVRLKALQRCKKNEKFLMRNFYAVCGWKLSYSLTGDAAVDMMSLCNQNWI